MTPIRTITPSVILINIIFLGVILQNVAAQMLKHLKYILHFCKSGFDLMKNLIYNASQNPDILQNNTQENDIQQNTNKNSSTECDPT